MPAGSVSVSKGWQSESELQPAASFVEPAGSSPCHTVSFAKMLDDYAPEPVKVDARKGIEEAAERLDAIARIDFR